MAASVNSEDMGDFGRIIDGLKGWDRHTRSIKYLKEESIFKGTRKLETDHDIFKEILTTGP